MIVKMKPVKECIDKFEKELVNIKGLHEEIMKYDCSFNNYMIMNYVETLSNRLDKIKLIESDATKNENEWVGWGYLDKKDWSDDVFIRESFQWNKDADWCKSNLESLLKELVVKGKPSGECECCCCTGACGEDDDCG